MNNNKLTLDKPTLAEELNISVRTLERMISDGLMPEPCEKIGKIVWPRVVIEQWLMEQYKKPEQSVEGKKRGRKRLAP
ncbi:helix-turn-helix transcriptional regulator [Methylomonas sp. 2BW1-5-20]|uniref:helix-turn-helix transcriptional regulator n=1 Tax=Methylomonas sp. 2BW1-5-20 TaxID=3376686 RepID=UPI00404CD58B